MRGRNSKGNVFVGNLPPDFSDERLAEAFDPFGIVLSAVVARDPSTGARLRYGFVDIATERAATQAISALDGSDIDGCKLNVKASERRAAVKKPGYAAPSRARQPFAAPAPRRAPIPEMAREAHGSNPWAEGPRPPADLAEMPARPAQSSMIADQPGDIGPPPRRDFEIVYKPARRKTPSFQVERRALPRRGA